MQNPVNERFRSLVCMLAVGLAVGNCFVIGGHALADCYDYSCDDCENGRGGATKCETEGGLCKGTTGGMTCDSGTTCACHLTRAGTCVCSKGTTE